MLAQTLTNPNTAPIEPLYSPYGAPLAFWFGGNEASCRDITLSISAGGPQEPSNTKFRRTPCHNKNKSTRSFVGARTYSRIVAFVC